MEKELGPILEEISISLSLNLSSLCYEVSLEELKFLLDSYNFQDPLMSSSVMFDPSSYAFGNLDDTSLVELKIVGFAIRFDMNSLQHVYTITSMRGKRHTMEFEGQGVSEIFWKHDLAKEKISTSKDFCGSYRWTRSVSFEFHCLKLKIKQLRKCLVDSLKWKREKIWCYHLQFEELSWKFGVANEVQNDVKSFNTNSLTSKRNFLANDICDFESLLS
ncbi:hypothetical protein M9H77_36214 [Catharanthus roseus]|uniref:Uncharacterized protein n=1 Tax=Catharanthus roseus TaxID=4058 RepID=A0ACB9ZR78_CATRO|nr:hypothetical protein M9H77_36214 [Catharanthus roseus]